MLAKESYELAKKPVLFVSHTNSYTSSALSVQFSLSYKLSSLSTQP